MTTEKHILTAQQLFMMRAYLGDYVNICEALLSGTPYHSPENLRLNADAAKALAEEIRLVVVPQYPISGLGKPSFGDWMPVEECS